MKWNNVFQDNSTMLLVSAIMMGCLLVMAMVALLLYRFEKERLITKSVLELNKLTNSIHAGLVHFIPEGSCKIRNASKGFYDLLGHNTKYR